mgnify:CR=1 FL=1
MKKILSLATIAIFTFACFGCQNNKKNSDLENAAQADSLQQVIRKSENIVPPGQKDLQSIQPAKHL